MLNLLVKPGWLFVENMVQDQVGHESWGVFSALFAFTFIFSAFSDMGINQFTTKQLAASPGFSDDYYPALIPVKTFLTLVFPVLIVLAGWAWGYTSSELYLLVFIAFSFTVMQFILFFRGTLQASQLFNTDAISSVLDKFILVLFIFGLLIFGWLNLFAYVYVRTIATVVTLFILYLLVRRQYGRIGFRFDWHKTKLVFRGALPFALITLVYGLNEKIDMVLLKKLAHDEEVGLYAAAYRWVDAVMMYLWTILPVFFAKFALHVEDKTEQKKLLDFGQVVVSVPIIFVCVFVFFYGEKLFFQFDNSTPAQVDLMVRNSRILFLSVLVHGFFAIYSTLLTSSNYERPVSYLVAASILLNVILNIIFIPVYGSVAASVNTLVSAVFVSLGYMLMLRRSLQISFSGLLLLKLAASAAVLCGVQAVLAEVSGIWWFNSVVAGVIYVASLFLFKIVRPGDIRQLLKKKK